MTAALVAAGAVLGTLAVVLLVTILVRRAERAAERRAAEAVLQMESALEQAREESRRVRILGELGETLEPDEVIGRVLEAAASLPGAEASLVTLRTPDGDPVVASFGLSPEEVERQRVPAVDDPSTRSVAVYYDYEPGEIEPTEQPVRGGVAVPLPDEVESLGMLAIFTRSAGSFGGAVVLELESLAARAAPMIENARRFREARELADIDALTGLHNRRYFHETLAREVARSLRYGRPLALVILDLDDFKAVNDRIGHLAGDDVLAETGERMRSVVRSADVACRIGGEEFAVLLPESTLADAEQLYERLAGAVASRPIGNAGDLSLSGGITHLRPGEDRTSFFERADEALYRAKAAGKKQAYVANGPEEEFSRA